MDKFKKKSGAWRLESVVRRYWRLCLKSSNPTKVSNALLALYEMLVGTERPKSRPFILRVEPTNNCNLHCPKCATGIGADPRPKGYMSFTDFKQILDQVKRYCFFVRLDGLGEPMLHPRLYDFIRYAKQNGVATALSTNLHFLPGGPEALLKSGLDHIIISLDGINQETYERYRKNGDYDKVMKNLHEIVTLKKNGNFHLMVEVQYIMFDFNKLDLEEYYSFASEIGADRVTIINIEGRKPQKAIPGKPKRCYWLWCVLTVDWLGEMRLCANSFTFSYPSICISRNKQEGFWNNEAVSRFRRFNVNSKYDYNAKSSQGARCPHCPEMLVIDNTEEIKKNYICT